MLEKGDEPIPANKKIALTDRSMKALKHAPERGIVWDAMMPGMAVRVGKTKRSFYAVKRRQGQAQPTWVLLGHYPVMTLAQARAKARETLGALAEGLDPAALAEAKRREEEEAERRRQASTFAAVAEDFAQRLVSGRIPKARGKGPLRDPGATAAILRREWVPPLGVKPVTEITRVDIRNTIEGILARGGDKPPPGTRRASGGLYAARHAFGAVRRLFDWLVARDEIAQSPCERLKPRELYGSPEARTRVLDDEVRRVWAAAEATAYPYGPLVQTLILTAQRRDEIAGARWSEVDLERGVLTIGPERMKNDAGHVVPLAPKVVEILRGLPRFSGGFIFSGQTGDRPFSGFSKAKKRLDREIGEIKPFTLHDLRRTVRTRLAELGVTPFVGELVIGHTQKGVHAVYDLHRYEDEKREALLKWEAMLLSIVAPEPEGGNIVPMRARG
jgi:integrase